MKKILFIVLDGLGDRPVAELGDRTPLEAADLPHLNRLAASGQQGTVITVGKGIAPESDVAVMAILGYDPLRFHAGRGPLEALGAGLPFQDGDLALRGNFATLGAGHSMTARRRGRRRSWSMNSPARVGRCWTAIPSTGDGASGAICPPM